MAAAVSSAPLRPAINRLAVVAEAVRRNPLQALGIGFLAGFVIGGGQQSRAGQELIGIATRLMVRQAVFTGISEALVNHE